METTVFDNVMEKLSTIYDIKEELSVIIEDNGFTAGEVFNEYPQTLSSIIEQKIIS